MTTGNRGLWKHAGLAAIAIGFLVQTAPAAGADLDTLRATWLSARTPDQYKIAVKALIDYRKAARFAKTAEIDYMIATGLCRIPDHESEGQRHFLWIIDNYSLGPDEGKVLDEQRSCGGQAAPQRIAFAMTPGQSGPAGIHSKLFYWLGREDIAVSSEPAEVVEQIGAEELRARLFNPDALQAAEAATRDRLGVGVTVAGGDGFVLASTTGYTPPQLEEIAAKLGQFASFYVGAYGLRSPPKLVTVYLAPDPYAMGKLALKLHGLKIPDAMIGYSYVDDLSMLGIVREKAIGTLGHELFHLMVRDQEGDLPPWLEEGIAALYESSNIAEKYLPGGPSGAVSGEVPMVGGELAVRGLPNWRGCVLEKLWLGHFNGIQVKRPTLAELVGMDWTAFNNSGPGDASNEERAAQQAVNHATARYLMLYLQDQGQKLFSVFHSFAARDPFAIQVPPTEDAKQRLAEQLGPLDQADAAFESWLRGILPTQACEQG